MQTTLLNAVTATGAGTAQQFSDYARGTTTAGIVQAVLTGTATVELQGSLNGTDWFTVQAFTASGAYGFAPPPWLRGNVTARTSGAITLIVDVATR